MKSIRISRLFFLAAFAIILTACPAADSGGADSGTDSKGDSVDCPKENTEIEFNVTVESRDVDQFYTAIESLNGGVFTGDSLWEKYLKDASLGTKMIMGIQKGIKPDEKVLYSKTTNLLLPFYKRNKERIRSHIISKRRINELINKINSAWGNQYKDMLSNKKVHFVTGGYIGGVAVTIKDNVSINLSLLKGNDFSGTLLESLSSPDLEFIIAHEFSHIVYIDLTPEKEDDSPNLLQAALIEGGANYLASMVLGEERYEAIYSKAIAHIEKNNNEKRLLKEFLYDAYSDINSRSAQKWISNTGGYPWEQKDGFPDMAYRIGYVIAKKYFEASKTRESHAAMVDALIKASRTPKTAIAFTEKAGLKVPEEY